MTNLISFYLWYTCSVTKENTSPSLPTNTNMQTNYYPPYRSSDQLTRKLSPAERKISPSFNRSSRSPSRAEVDEAIRTLRTPSPGPTSSDLYGNGTRSRLAYYKSPASPTNIDSFDYGRRSMSPPSRSPSRFSSISSTPKITAFPSKLEFNQPPNEVNQCRDSKVSEYKISLTIHKHS